MPIDEFCTVRIPSHKRTAAFDENDLKFLVGRLQTALARRGFESGELFGSSTDLWFFTVRTDTADVEVGISPEKQSDDDFWSVQVHLEDPGWFKSTREKRMSQADRIEWAIHDALKLELDGRVVEWHLGPGRVRPGQGVPTPRNTS